MISRRFNYKYVLISLLATLLLAGTVYWAYAHATQRLKEHERYDTIEIDAVSEISPNDRENVRRLELLREYLIEKGYREVEAVSYRTVILPGWVKTTQRMSGECEWILRSTFESDVHVTLSIDSDGSYVVTVEWMRRHEGVQEVDEYAAEQAKMVSEWWSR